MQNLYEKPKVLKQTQIRFETTPSGDSGNTKGKFPGLGWGVGGTPAQERGDFPGGGSTGGQFPGRGPTTPNRP